MPAPARPAYLTLTQALTEIGISRAAFYRWRARGVAPRVRKLPNGQLRISRTDLDAWLDTLYDCEDPAR